MSIKDAVKTLFESKEEKERKQAEMISQAIKQHEKEKEREEEEKYEELKRQEEERLEQERIRVATAKKEATEKGIPWFTIIDFNLDPENVTVPQYVEFDWNDAFIQKLKALGINGTDEEIIDQYFQDLCKTIALQSYDEDVFEKTDTVDKIRLENGKVEYK